MKQLIIIGGPTGVGKTALAIDLAKHWQTDVISADSRQLYHEMSIGTGKPSVSELSEIKHHFINERYVNQPFTAADFERESLDRLGNLFNEKSKVVCAGGTGLFIKALVEGFDKIPDVPQSIVDQLELDYQQYGLVWLQQQIKSKDAVYASTVDLSNPHRLLRALSVIESTDTPFSSFLSGNQSDRPFESIKICLIRERQELYDRINARVDEMVENGLIEEARKLFHLADLRALQTVGYQELFSCFNGEIDLQRAIELIKQNSRRYAKRQLTWFRNQGQWIHINLSEVDKPFEKVLEIVNQ